MSKYRLKQVITDLAKSTGLNKIEVSTFPSASFSVYLRKERDNLTWVTGLNENSPRVLNILDENLKQKEITRIKSERERLSNSTGLDLTPHSAYWKTFEMRLILPFEPESTLDKDNAADMILYYAAIENRILAPSFEDLNTERYKDAKLYVYDEEQESNKKYRKLELSEEISSKVFSIKDNYNKLYYLCKSLNITVNKDMSSRSLYILIGSYKEKLNSIQEHENFLNILNTPNEELMADSIVDTAIKNKVIYLENGILTWGGSQWGTTKNKAVKKFLQHEESLAALQEELLGKNIK